MCHLQFTLANAVNANNCHKVLILLLSSVKMLQCEHYRHRLCQNNLLFVSGFCVCFQTVATLLHVNLLNCVQATL